MHKLRVFSFYTFALLICLLIGCAPAAPVNEPVSIEVSESSYEPMNDFLERFQAAFSESSRVADKPVDELFPAEEIPADELSWFLESYEDVTVKACKGLRFDNDDILIAFFYDTEVLNDTLLEHITININMYGSPLIPPPEVKEYGGNCMVDDGFGVIAYSFSGSNMDQLIADIAFDSREH